MYDFLYAKIDKAMALAEYFGRLLIQTNKKSELMICILISGSTKKICNTFEIDHKIIELFSEAINLEVHSILKCRTV